MANVKTEETKNKAWQIFQKTNIFYPLIPLGLGKFIFWKIWHALFSCYHRFDVVF